MEFIKLIQKISNAQYAYILVLENNHNLKVPQTLFIYNILDFLSFENTKFVLALPEITYANSIASSGGKANGYKFHEVRQFIIEEFNKIKAAYPETSMKIISTDITAKIRQKFPNNIYQFGKYIENKNFA